MIWFNMDTNLNQCILDATILSTNESEYEFLVAFKVPNYNKIHLVNAVTY